MALHQDRSGAASAVAKRQCRRGDPWQHRRSGSGNIGGSKLIEPGGDLRGSSSVQGRRLTRIANIPPTETMLASPARIEGGRHGEAQEANPLHRPAVRERGIDPADRGLDCLAGRRPRGGRGRKRKDRDRAHFRFHRGHRYRPEGRAGVREHHRGPLRQDRRLHCHRQRIPPIATCCSTASASPSRP